ncbi:Chaperone surA [Gossypium australe]|uniref:Chaperone surA n=1 Tax=Gossypium australe TaxID=47621 RepID=A0A5B6V927_9ROSI|nr:Chaperone surA [Gossypium australe]
MYALFPHGLRHRRVWSRVRHTACSHGPDEVDSNATASVQRTTPFDFRPVMGSQGGEAKEAFFQMMNEWFTHYIRTNLAAQQPLPPPNPQPVPLAPQRFELLRLNKPPVDKIRKHGAKEFRANVNDGPKRAEFWLENMIRVFDKLSCKQVECLKCAVSLLRDTA